MGDGKRLRKSKRRTTKEGERESANGCWHEYSAGLRATDELLQCNKSMKQHAIRTILQA